MKKRSHVKKKGRGREKEGVGRAGAFSVYVFFSNILL
jgi:hypothetical protein